MPTKITKSGKIIHLPYPAKKKPRKALTEREYPVLARIWKNDSDKIFDTL